MKEINLITKIGYFSIILLFIGGFSIIWAQESLSEGIIAFGIWQSFTFLIFSLCYQGSKQSSESKESEE